MTSSTSKARGRRTPPPELVEYFETHRTPGGVAWDELLARHIKYMNDADLPEPDVREITVRRTDAWDLRIAVWRRDPGARRLPVVFHVHGGAWSAGNHLSFPGVAAVLADAGYLVVSVDYRRAPRHTFPAAYDDCVFVLKWCGENISAYGGDPNRLALLGDSAGANLAAAAMITVKKPRVKCAVLLYGLFEFSSSAPVMNGLGLPTEYVPTHEIEGLRDDPRLNPIVSPADLQPSLVLTGDRDWAVDQSRLLKAAMEVRGARHEYAELEATPHGFLLLPGHPGYVAGWKVILRYLKEHLEADADSAAGDRAV